MCRAAEWMSLRQSMLAQQTESVDVFIAFKIALLQRDDDAALEALHQLVRCPDYHPDILKVKQENPWTSHLSNLYRGHARRQ